MKKHLFSTLLDEKTLLDDLAHDREAPLDLDGWVVKSSGREYDGWMVKGDESLEAWDAPGDINAIRLSP